MKFLFGILLVVVGVLIAAYFNLFLLVVGIIDIFQGGSIFWGVFIIVTREIVAGVIALIFFLSGLALMGVGEGRKRYGRF